MPIIPANNVEVKDEGVSQGFVRTLDFVGSSVAAVVAGSTGTITVSAGAAGDIALSLLAPAVDETITAGYSAVLVRSYTVASGKKLTIGSAARMRIL